jgi:hypothetical protein
MCSVPDLDISQDDEGVDVPTNHHQTPSSLFELAEDERGVTVTLFNFLMVLIGLSRINNPSCQKAITAV